MLITNPSHISYVTNDLDAAMATYRTRFGVRDFMLYDTSNIPNSGGQRLALAYTGSIFLELFEPGPGTADFFRFPFEPGVLSIRHHHVGYLVPDEAAWQRLLEDLAAQQFPIVSSGEQPGAARYLFADTRSVDGIYREFVLHIGEEGHQTYARIPRNF